MLDNPLTKSVQPRSTGTLYHRRERQSWPADRDFRVLSLDGGGIRGILPLAVMARLEKDYLGGRSIAGYFDLVTGTSTGGIIALGLARGLTATEILKIYVERGGEVFPDIGPVRRSWLAVSKLVLNRCNTEKLYKLIDEVVGGFDLWQSSLRLCIPAAETRHFEPFVFKTPHHPDYSSDWRWPMAHVAKTTSAAPGHFRPVVREDGFEFIDGGIWANNPIMVAVADALACFDIRREAIKVLSLGCVQSTYEMSWARRNLGGLLNWTSLMFETMHIQSQNAVGQARLIAGGDHVLRLDAPPISPAIELWDWARSKAELPTMGDALVSLHGSAVAAMFFDAATAPYSPIYRPTHALS